MLNPLSLEQHKASKRHMRRLGKEPGDDFDPICLAEDVQVS